MGPYSTAYVAIGIATSLMVLLRVGRSMAAILRGDSPDAKDQAASRDIADAIRLGIPRQLFAAALCFIFIGAVVPVAALAGLIWPLVVAIEVSEFLKKRNPA